MKSLLLLRHAKSSKDDPSLADFDRPLNDRGKSDAELIGKFIKTEKTRPDLIISSPAKRARKTTDLVLNAAGLKIKTIFDERIYGAAPRDLLKIISEINYDPDTVMLVGHNPGFEDLLEALTNQKRELPTASLTLIQLSITEWSRVRPKVGKIEWLIIPRQLRRS